MQNRRLQQFAISFLIVLSLFVSSVSACACAHHQEEKAETKISSCHQPETRETKTENHHQSDSTETVQTVISEGDCNCVQPAPKVVSKNENFKFEKQTVALLPKLPVEIKVVPHIVSADVIDFEPPFYLSDSFYNISPSRGPPSRL